jgi:hypothetical protein
MASASIRREHLNWYLTMLRYADFDVREAQRQSEIELSGCPVYSDSARDLKRTHLLRLRCVSMCFENSSQAHIDSFVRIVASLR